MRNTIVKKTANKGKGIFAAKDFKKGEVILKWRPKKLKSDEVNKLSAKQKTYIYSIAKNSFFLMQPPEKYVNHSCDPNTKAKDNSDVAIKDIKKGEEITSDYGKSLTKFKCKCGGKNCRNII